MNKLSVLGIVSFFAIASLWLFNHLTATPDEKGEVFEEKARVSEIKGTANGESNESPKGDGLHVERLQKRVQELEHVNKELIARLESLKGAERTSGSLDGNTVNATEILAKYGANSEVMEFENKLQSEDTDVAWAKETNKAIERTLQDKKMHEFSVVGFECRTTICRTEMVTNNISEADRAEALFRTEVGKSFSGKIETLKVNTPPGSGMRVYFFLLRNGYRSREG